MVKYQRASKNDFSTENHLTEGLECNLSRKGDLMRIFPSSYLMGKNQDSPLLHFFINNVLELKCWPFKTNPYVAQLWLIS